MPHIASSFWQPGRRGGGRRWAGKRTGTRKRRTKEKRRQLHTRTAVTRQHSWQPQPQPQQAVSSATSRTTPRLPSIVEEEEEAEKEQVVGKGEVVRVEAKVSSVAAAAPLECNEGGFGGAAPAVDWAAYRPASQHYNGYLRAAPAAAAHYSVAYSTAAAAVTAPATAHAPAAEAEEERVEKEDGLEVVKEVGEEEKMPEEAQGAEEEKDQAAGEGEREKEDEEEAVEMEAAAPSVAAAAARRSTARGFGVAALATVWDACRKSSRNFFGSPRTAPPPAAENDSVAYSTTAAAATAPARAAAAAVETPSACVDRGHERGEEGEEDRKEKGEGHTGESAGETTLANLGNGGEYGSPVPAKFRPENCKDDALCSWKQAYFVSVPDAKTLGTGSFGIVVTAKLNTGKEMAMKVMARTNPVEERTTKNEVDILEQCSAHPNVVDYYGFIRTPTRLCVLMPMASCDLADMIKKYDLTEKQAVSIARQLVSAVAFLHGRGIIHRDIKPGNILIGEGNVVLLADFGLAVTTNGHLISGESACGTLPYMAPELLKELPYGSAVDMWATGVVTFEMLYRVRPFTDGGGNSGGSGGGNHSGSVSNTSGSIVTDSRNMSGSMETPGGTKREKVLQRKILLGEYYMDTSLVGGNGRDFISQLLSKNPHERATAVQAAEHGWIHDSSNASRRKRKARLTVALVTMERAMSAVQRLQVRVQPLSDLGRAAAKTTSTAVAEVAAAAASAVSSLDQLVAMLSDIKAMGEEAKKSEKAKISGRVTNGGDEDAAEEVVRTVEMFATEAEGPVTAATATVDSWEKAVRQAALP